MFAGVRGSPGRPWRAGRRGLAGTFWPRWPLAPGTGGNRHHLKGSVATFGDLARTEPAKQGDAYVV